MSMRQATVTAFFKPYMHFIVFLTIFAVVGLLPVDAVGAPNNRIYPYAMGTYLGIFAATHFYFGKHSTTRKLRIGYALAATLSAYGVNEVAFKLSFPLLDSSPPRFTYLFTYDLQPLIVFSIMVPVYLVTSPYWSIRNKYFMFSAGLFILSWVAWWNTGFPLTHQQLIEHESARKGVTLFGDIATKLTTVNLYLAVLKRPAADST